MTKIGNIERNTQNSLIRLFREKLGYRYAGNLADQKKNSNLMEQDLRRFLKKSHSDQVITKTIGEFTKCSANMSNGLFECNKRVYHLLRYGIPVQADYGKKKETVFLIDWKNPSNNDFAVAEEVTVKGKENVKRPDLVLYVNGIALGVMELKRSTVSVSEGIRQNLDNQKEMFIASFFATVQLIFAGNSTQGLHYGVVETPEKYWLKWKEPNASIADELERSVTQMCGKERFLELIHDYIAYDRGIKKVCRPNQYFGVKAAQVRIAERDGGVIWHTQGSGKSLTMVWLSKWIHENIDNARVLIITDRDELDKQIEKVYKGVDEEITRTRNGKELIDLLNEPNPWLICSLIHKFGVRTNNNDELEGDVKGFIEELQKSLPPGFKPKGNLFVFVDECHRTQSGDLHKAMKSLLPDALFIGFTGTPLLKKDKQTSIEVFGTYIHTYKFNEAVKDGVVLDLRYEARDVDQYINQPDKIDTWFDAKTKGLTEIATAQLKQKWGTMKNIFSSRERLSRIVEDICFDMETKPRLQNGRGNAMLVSGSIYQACRFYEMFQHTELKDRCAIITSYSPNPADVKGEESGAGVTERLLQYQVYQEMLNGETPEAFEDRIKKQFIDEPARMKLLIVVDKLLTGFDAPSATYLYIDKSMQDHGLFQAICRVNRLDGDDKEYGYVIDYKDLFGSLEKAVDDYTTGAFADYDKDDVKGLLNNRLECAKQDLDDALEAVRAMLEVVSPHTSEAFIQYFVTKNHESEQERMQEQVENGSKRLNLYKLVASLLRKYMAIAGDMVAAGYTPSEAEQIKSEVKKYSDLRDEIKLASGDYIDLKLYEPGMRQLLDLYIRADGSEKLVDFEDFTLIELVVEQGERAIEKLTSAIRVKDQVVAEIMEANMRKLIIDESAANPVYYEQMSVLLQQLIEERRQNTIDYKTYLHKVIELSKKLKNNGYADYPEGIASPGIKAIYDNLEKDVYTAKKVHKAVREAAMDDWRNSEIKCKKLRVAIKTALGKDSIDDDVNRLIEIIKMYPSEY